MGGNDKPMKTVAVTDFLTDEQIVHATRLWREGIMPARRICELIIKPNMAEINRKTGQENDPMFLAYAVEHVLNQAALPDAVQARDEWIKEAVAAGGVPWSCPAGHVGVFGKGTPQAKRLGAFGPEPRGIESSECPGCRGEG